MKDKTTRDNLDLPIEFFADKVYVHRWPKDSIPWGDYEQNQIDKELNKNLLKKQILVTQKTIRINDFEFLKIKNVGLTIPLFKKETTVVFEGSFKGLSAHTHITTMASDYLDLFNGLMKWKTTFFPD